MSKVKRIYVEKKTPFAVQASGLASEIRSYLGIRSLTSVRVLIRYDVENISDDVFAAACRTVFSEPPVDILFHDTFPCAEDDFVFSVEFLPGQFDQRADSACQCVQLLSDGQMPVVRSAVTYVISGSLTPQEREAIIQHCVNPVDSRVAGEAVPDTLVQEYPVPDAVSSFDGFTRMDEDALRSLYESLSLAMTFRDFLHIQKYYAGEEKRDPTVTEIRVLDTYWSDHCRHTTFSTELTKVAFEDGFYRTPIEKSYKRYLSDRTDIYKGRDDKYVCLMDLALLAMKKLKAEGKLKDQEESEEINACSIIVPVDVDGREEEWLLNFKNETHNHPTEIEPFGGAATCLGGAIRDPLSGRTYVYQAMRVTGAADPTVPVSRTWKGKLPQKKLVREAAAGYSSYGNQIGLATGYVKEIYHPGYAAKRMEIGAVLGAAPRESVIRKTPQPGDAVILLGGRTGRDGIGGATGSSKVHTEASIEVCGAEVQKGNAPTERKLQRMFRRPEVSRLILKCNDFGAGGVCVAIGELSPGIRINLDRVPKKYAGLDGTELAISESQERMAVVVSPSDVSEFMDYAAEENLEAVLVAEVTDSGRLVMTWNGQEIVNISRAFLDTNGAHQEQEILVQMPDPDARPSSGDISGDLTEAVRDQWLSVLKDLNVCSQKGLVEMFDSSIGAGTVLMPYGGRYQLTQAQVMAAKFPVEKGTTRTVSLMSCGFDPFLSSWSPYHGAAWAVTESVARIVAAGGDPSRIRFTFQEYFRRMSAEPARWSQPFAALLGAYEAQLGFGLPAIGGKDSMSGTFGDRDVPPTLVSFAVAVGKQEDVISPELKAAGNCLVWIRAPKDSYDLPDYQALMTLYRNVRLDMQAGRVLSAYALDRFGLCAAVSRMAFGNGLGVRIEHDLDPRDFFAPGFGDLVLEVPAERVGELKCTYRVIGRVTSEPVFAYGHISFPMQEALTAWKAPLEKIFPTVSGAPPVPAAEPLDESGAGGSRCKESGPAQPEDRIYRAGRVYRSRFRTARPRVFIPVFPGTNCEYDSAKAFREAGAEVDVRVFKNRDAADIRDSVLAFSQAIAEAQIIMFPGGFSAGDEPDGSAKFFAAAFRSARIREEVQKLLNERDGLALGICNGFQALIKLGLVPTGTITPQTEHSPTLTCNTLGRHISRMVYTRVVSNLSPWLMKAEDGGVYCNPASHGEGRFVAEEDCIRKLFANGQVATRYTDPDGRFLQDEEWNVNGSYYNIEGITSPDGRVLGKMAHCERRGEGVAVNIEGRQDMGIFEAGVAYFRDL